jgi:hypothetical protein
MNRLSHEYQFVIGDVTRVLAVPLTGLVLLAALVHGAALSGWMPESRPADMDRTILAHQADASGRPSDAELVLVGDSSCLMNVSARQLAHDFGRPVLNLATLSFVSLSDHARLLARFEQTNGSSPRIVILLLNPEALRRAGPSASHVAFLQARLAGLTEPAPTNVVQWVSRAVGLDRLHGSVLNRILPAPLPGEFATAYGFTSDLWQTLSRNGGSLADPNRFDPTTAKGSPDYRLARSLEVESREFRSRLPAGAQLWVGITPLPESFAGPAHADTVRELLATWQSWLGADRVLDGLPATMPDALFASLTHLNAAGAEQFTAHLASQLRGKAGASNPP